LVSFFKTEFILGVTGHRDLHPEDLPSLRGQLLRRFEAMGKTFINSPAPIVVSGLARGADQLVAHCALEFGWRIGAVLPMPQQAFVTTPDFVEFPKAFADFAHLLVQCKDRVIELDWPSPPFDPDILNVMDQAYRNQSAFIARECQAVWALWDGAPALTGACGTSYVADLCLQQDPSAFEWIKVRRAVIDPSG
jgi:hypothetical protein